MYFFLVFKVCLKCHSVWTTSFFLKAFFYFLDLYKCMLNLKLTLKFIHKYTHNFRLHLNFNLLLNFSLLQLKNTDIGTATSATVA